MRKKSVVCLPDACISTTLARFWRCKFLLDALGSRAKSKRRPDSSSSSSSKLPDLRRDDLTVERAGGDVLGAGVPLRLSPKEPPLRRRGLASPRRRGLASPGEARGVACAVGVDCWEDIVYVAFAACLQRLIFGCGDINARSSLLLCSIDAQGSH